MSPKHAPEFPANLEWVNCDPMLMADQTGRVVLLLFWSASSAYCHNLLLDVQMLAAKHSESITVVAVHTPKFEAERSSRLAWKAVNRLGFKLPVVHDPDFVLWQHYEVHAWPTAVLVDTRGERAQVFEGDDCRVELERAIAGLLDAAGAEQRMYAHLPPCVRPEPKLPLAFPCGLAVGPSHLYIADTGHHRVLECTLEGRILRQFGTASPGFVDGSSGESCFQSPRGLYLGRDYLYVCDTGNHAVRRIGLLNGETDTIAGTGQRGGSAALQGQSPTQCALDTPWAITGNFDKLFIAMAAGQQIWEYDQIKRSLRVLVGNGQIGLVDGSAERGALAQPAGLALVQQTLYVADSASSAIRGVHTQGGQVHTLIGQGLYEFGDQDGARHTALLQHPLALALDTKAPQLWIADSYNNQIKYLRLGGGELRRFDFGYGLHEPAAIACSAGILWVANTNSHEVLRVEIDSAQVRRLPIGE